jgi:hypothetical protein
MYVCNNVHVTDYTTMKKVRGRLMPFLSPTNGLDTFGTTIHAWPPPALPRLSLQPHRAPHATTFSHLLPSSLPLDAIRGRTHPMPRLEPVSRCHLPRLPIRRTEFG